jgi:hypothetical protein
LGNFLLAVLVAIFNTCALGTFDLAAAAFNAAGIAGLFFSSPSP